MTRLLAIMGSGETSPTMVKVHRSLFERLGPDPVPAVVLDTPFGFQENAGELTAKAIEYFRESVGRDLGVASLRDARAAGPLEVEIMLNALRDARFVFAGPGSPSYALRQWEGTRVPDILADKLRAGGAVVFASAAALTLGCVTVPVYEIYKVGGDVRWLPGLDLLAETGLNAAVIPHYNNAEGGTHDTRYCYLGERRLQLLEAQLPDGAFVLGVDEHTGCVLDLDAGTATVVGLGVVTVRRDGASTELPSGTSVPIAQLRDAADVVPTPPSPRPAAAVPEQPAARSPLLDDLDRLEDRFSGALAGADARTATDAALELDATLQEWSTETFSGDEWGRARAAFRSMLARLGEGAVAGVRDPADVVGPFVDAVLEARQRLREAGRYDDADAMRDRLVALGVEVRDTADGSAWSLR